MIEQVSTSVKFLAFYTASKTGKTGLTVTVDVYDPSGTAIVTGASATAIGGGLYAYTLSSNNSAEGEYAAIFKTSDSTVDAQHIPSLWVLGRAGVENLDAATSSRLPTTSYTAPANSDISAIKAKTDNLPASPAAVSNIPTVAQIRTELDTNSTKLANLDATVSSRLATSGYTAPTTPPTVTAIRQEMDANSTKLANLDASVSSRLAASAYTAPTAAPTAAQNASAVRTELSTELGRIDASVSTRLAASAYTTPPTTAQISAAVEGSILNENDGQAVLNAIVGAIGNQNVDQIALVAAIRSDLERNGGKLSSIPSDVWAANARTITGGTVDTLVNSPSVPSAASIATATRQEMDANSTQLSAIKSKTDNLPASPAAVSNIPTVAQIRTELDTNSTKLANLDATVSSRLATSGYTAPTTPPTVTAIRQEMDANSTKLANLDASVSSRLAPSGTLARVTLVDTATTLTNSPSVPSAASIASATRSELSVELGRIDQAVSTRLAAADYTAPTSAPTAAAVASAVRSELTELSNLDASVSSRLAASSYTAPANSDISAIKSKTDALPAIPAAKGDIPTTAQIATAVEGSILNENDGQAVLNAIVGAIGNTNVSEVSLVAAIRSDLERNGGKLDSIPTTSAPTTSEIWNAATRTLTSASGPTAAQIRAEIDANSSSISAIKNKTDALDTTRLGNVSTVATTGAQLAAALS